MELFSLFFFLLKPGSFITDFQCMFLFSHPGGLRCKAENLGFFLILTFPSCALFAFLINVHAEHKETFSNFFKLLQLKHRFCVITGAIDNEQ